MRLPSQLVVCYIATVVLAIVCRAWSLLKAQLLLLLAAVLAGGAVTASVLLCHGGPLRWYIKRLLVRRIQKSLRRAAHLQDVRLLLRGVSEVSITR